MRLLDDYCVSEDEMRSVPIKEGKDSINGTLRVDVFVCVCDACVKHRKSSFASNSRFCTIKGINYIFKLDMTQLQRTKCRIKID